MANSHDQETINHLIKFIKGGQAFAPMSVVLANIPAEIRGVQPSGLPYSIWQQVEHIRIAQWDMLDFSRNPDYKEISWPADYWPKETAPKDDAAWDHAINQIFEDEKAFIALLEAPDVDLYTPFAWGKGQCLLREAMLVANHNSHHAGQIIILRRLLGHWKERK